MIDRAALARLLEEISAAPTQDAAKRIARDSEHLFRAMTHKEREDAFTRIDDIINEKPD